MTVFYTLPRLKISTPAGGKIARFSTSPPLYSNHTFFPRAYGHLSAQKAPSKHHLYWFAFSAMISGVIMMVVLICYCCHKNVRKHRPQEYSQYWRTEPDIHSLEVFTMDTHVSNIFDQKIIQIVNIVEIVGILSKYSFSMYHISRQT